MGTFLTGAPLSYSGRMRNRLVRQSVPSPFVINGLETCVLQSVSGGRWNSEVRPFEADKLSGQRGHYELALAMTLILYLRTKDYKADIRARGETRARKAAHGEGAIRAA
jgi:hypothetical protein